MKLKKEALALALRQYEKRRKLGTALVVATFVLFAAACVIVKDTANPGAWALWTGFILFVVSCVVFLSLTRCPHCGRTIVIGAMTRKNCSHCGKALTDSSVRDKTNTHREGIEK